MNTKHTPGRWVYGNWCTGVEGEFDSAGWVEIWAEEDGGIASLPIIACKHQDEMANARLIAAAPELLEALQMFLDDYEGGGDAQSCARMAKKVIAKATGEQP